MKIFLVRHGETEWNSEGKFQGQIDIPLNDIGLSQSLATARASLRWGLTALYSSPLKRTMQVSEHISSITGIPISPAPGLMELNLGSLEGITGNDMRRNWPEVWNQWRVDPSAVSMPKGESLISLSNRSWETFKTIEQTHSNDDQIAIVSHNFVIRCICARILEMPLSNFHSMTLSLSSITTVELFRNAWRLISYNSVSHLITNNGSDR